MKEVQQSSGQSDLDNLLERSILDVGIPPCPVILDRFMSEARRDDPDFARLAHIIGSDVGLSAGLIKTANSPYFGVRQRVRSVNEALAVLGLKAASRAVAGIILRNIFPPTLHLERFWDASARIARASGWLAQHLELRGLRAEDAYTYGLFRDCGIPVLLGKFPAYEALLVRANQDAAGSFTAVEESGVPTNHAMVGCILAQNWWLPEEICLAIRNHHDLGALESLDSRLPLLTRRLIATAQLAEYLLQQQMGLSLTQEWGKLGAAALKLLGLEEEQLESLCQEVMPVLSGDE